MQLEITKSNRTHGAIQQIHRQLSNLLRRQAEDIQRLVQSLKSLQNEQGQLEAPASPVLEPLERSLPDKAGTGTYSPSCILRVNRTLADVETAAGIEYADNATEQPAGDDAQVAPQQAILSPEIPVLGTFEVVYGIELHNRNMVKEGAGMRIYISASKQRSIAAGKPTRSALLIRWHNLTSFAKSW